MGSKIAKALLQPINTSAVIILGLYTMLWGFWVANPWWDVFSRAPLYDAMGAIAPEWVWGVFAIAVGALTVYGAARQHFKILTHAAWAISAMWLIIAGFYFVADWMNTGGITSLMISLYGAFVYLNIRVNNVLPEKVTKKRLEGSTDA